MESFINFYNDILSSNFDKIFFELRTLNVIIIVKKVLKEGRRINIILFGYFYYNFCYLYHHLHFHDSLI